MVLILKIGVVLTLNQFTIAVNGEHFGTKQPGHKIEVVLMLRWSFDEVPLYFKEKMIRFLEKKLIAKRIEAMAILKYYPIRCMPTTFQTPQTKVYKFPQKKCLYLLMHFSNSDEIHKEHTCTVLCFCFTVRTGNAQWVTCLR